MATADENIRQPSMLDSWNALPQQTKIVAAGIGLAVVAALIFGAVTLNQSDSGPSSPLLGGHQFSPQERNRAFTAFQEAGLSDYSSDGALILVPRGQENRYLAALSTGGALPGNYDNAYRQYIQNRTWWSSRTEADRLFLVAVQQNLAEQIETFPEVQSANVTVTTPPRRGLRSTGPVTAAVRVTSRTGQPLDPIRVQEIKELVAHSISGLTADNVYVAGDILNGLTGSGGSGSGGFGCTGRSCVNTTPEKLRNGIIQSKEAYAECIEKDICNIFAHLEGFRVTVNVEVNPDMDITQRQVAYDKGLPSESDTVENSSESTQATGPRGEPGVPPNVLPPGVPPNTGATAAGNSNSETSSETSSMIRFVNPTVETNKRVHNFVPRKVGVVVNVPRRYLEAGTDATGAQQTPETTIAEITEAIAALDLPGLTPETIRVVPYTPPPMPEIAAPTFSMTEYVQDYGASIFLGLLGAAAVIVALLIARRSTVPELPPLPSDEDDEDDRKEEVALPNVGGQEAHRRFEAMTTTIAQLIGKEPEIAAGLIRRWVTAAE